METVFFFLVSIFVILSLSPNLKFELFILILQRHPNMRKKVHVEGLTTQ